MLQQVYCSEKLILKEVSKILSLSSLLSYLNTAVYCGYTQCIQCSHGIILVSFSMTLAQFQLPSPVEFLQPGFENLGYHFVAVK